MIELRLSAAALGTTAFGFCPLGEMAHSIQVLTGRRGTNQAWRRWALPRTEGLDLGLLDLLMPCGRWVPGILVPLSDGPGTDVHDQLEELARVPVRRWRHELVQVWEGHDLPDRLARLLDDGTVGEVVAAELTTYWERLLAPHWPRLRGALERDVTDRIERAFTSGLAALFADLHPEVELRGDLLRVDKPAHQTVLASVDRLRLVPSAFVAPSLGLLHVWPSTFEITYPATDPDSIWEHVEPEDERADVAHLLGRTRADLLRALAVPMSTSHLARELGQSPATVSGHLAVLRGCGMVRSWRSGRSVLYVRTALGADLVQAPRATEGLVQQA